MRAAAPIEMRRQFLEEEPFGADAGTRGIDACGPGSGGLRLRVAGAGAAVPA